MDFQIINDALQKIISKPQLKNAGEKVKLRGQKWPAKNVKPFFFLQYRGNISLQLKQKLEKTYDLKTIFTMRKICTCLPSLKSNRDSNLKSHVVDELIWCGCSSTYVEQTRRHLTTRISDHQKTNSLVGQHVMECCGALTAFNNRIIDQFQDSK